MGVEDEVETVSVEVAVELTVRWTLVTDREGEGAFWTVEVTVAWIIAS